MTVASLVAQFSDVEKSAPIVFRSDSVPPLSVAVVLGTGRLTRVGQTIWCCVEAQNTLGFDAYVVMRPFFDIPLPEYRRANTFPLHVAAPTKRLDVIGPPSPFGSSLSEMLGEVWRFLIPAGATRSFAFFVPSDGMALDYAAWATDVAGAVLPIGGILATIWTTVGSAHALMVEQRAGRAA